MKAATIFAPALQYLLEHDCKTTNKQISKDTGISENRIKQLKDDPERATVKELEVITSVYHFTITI